MEKSLVIVSKSLAPYRVRFYEEIAAELKSRGWRVTLIAATFGVKDHPWEGLKDSTRELRIVEARGITPDSAFWMTVRKIFRLTQSLALPNWRLIELLEEAKPDVVWTHEYSPFCVTAALWASVRDRHCIVSTDLGSNPPRHACTPLQLRLQKMYSFLYEGVIANTPEATRRTHPEGAPVCFAPHAIDTDIYYPSDKSPKSPFRFLFVAALKKEKGLVVLVKAAAMLAEQGHDFVLRVVGTGPLASWLNGLDYKWLSVAGFQEGETLRQEYRNAHAYVMPTMGDTYGVTVHEAAASGLPLIVGKSAGAVETLVEESVSGFAIDPENVEELRRKMEELLLHPERALDMGKAARKLAMEYDVKKLGKKAAGFILETVGSRGLGPRLCKSHLP